MSVSIGSTHRGPLFGRVEEVQLLTSLLDGVEGTGDALVIRGDPGVGKSRLLFEAAAIARDRGFMVLSTAGVQSEAHLAFAGLHQLLRPVRSSLERLPEMQRTCLDTAFGLRDDPAPERFRIAMAALDLLCEVATETPLLIVAEDIQWLDQPSGDVLAFIARRVQSDPIVLLAAAREGYPSPLVDVGLPEYRLAGLPPAAAEELLDSSAPGLVPSVRDRLLGEAGGNPLALDGVADQCGSAPGSWRRFASAHGASRACVRSSCFGAPGEGSTAGGGCGTRPGGHPARDPRRLRVRSREKPLVWRRSSRLSVPPSRCSTATSSTFAIR